MCLLAKLTFDESNLKELKELKHNFIQYAVPLYILCLFCLHVTIVSICSLYLNVSINCAYLNIAFVYTLSLLYCVYINVYVYISIILYLFLYLLYK